MIKIRKDGHNSYSLVCDDPTGLALGMHTVIRDGVVLRHSIVACRNGVKVWRLDYKTERDCEQEMRDIRIWLDDLVSGIGNHPLYYTEACEVTLFNEVIQND